MGDEVVVDEVKPAAIEDTGPVIDAAVEEVIKEEAQTNAALDQLDMDSLADRVADKVYGKVKAFAESIVTASADVEKLVSESVAAKSEEVAPVEEEMEEADVKPVRTHKLFARRGKRD